MDKFNEKEFQKKYLKIKEKLLFDKSPVESPKVFVLGGQPGAGKSTLTSDIQEKMNKNIIVINGDDFRSSHPNYDELIKTYGDDSVLYTQKFSNAITEKLIEELGNKKYNLVVEGTLRTAETPLKTSKLLHEKGYSTTLSVICVKPEFSYLGTLERYQNMKENGLIARATPKKSHDDVVEKIADNLSAIYSKKEFDNIEIYTRDGSCLYSQKKVPEINPGEVIKKEFNRELTIEEKQKLINSYKNVKEKFNEKEENFENISKVLKGINQNYNCLTGCTIEIEAHSSAENKWIEKSDIKKLNIEKKENIKEYKIKVGQIEKGKCCMMIATYYNVNDLQITKEIEQKFVPMKQKEQEKTLEKAKSKGMEIGD